jgi:prepilin signal peptidase PulO-like enzyme (type II secretory pathway)
MITSFFVFFIGFLGLCVGSFINAWAWRTRERLPIAIARSMCTSCKVPLSWYDNIPLLSFIFLKGKCRSCAIPISWQYPIVELLGVILFLIIGWQYQFAVDAWPLILRDVSVAGFLLAVLVYDIRYMEILDRTTLLPAALLFIINLIFGWQSWSSMVIGAGIGAGFFAIQYIVSRGRWIGGGDIRLGAFMGVILGSPLIWMGLFFSYILGGVAGGVLLLMKKAHGNTALPFGLFLVPGTILAMLFGQRLLSWYIGLLF